jgi:glucosamine--fructose-6-phosphate aminotransferase (isomerizing)
MELELLAGSDVRAVIEHASRQGRPTIAITNRPGSPLAALAEAVLPLEAGDELAVAATKTYVAEIAVIAMLSAALSGDDRSREEAAASRRARAARTRAPARARRR